MTPPYVVDITRLAEALNHHEVTYVLVGGLATILHGGETFTRDADLGIAYNLDNVDRLVAALAPFRPRPKRLAEEAQWEFDRLSVRPPWTIFVTDLGRVDVITQLPGVDSFSGLHERSVVVEVEGVPVRIASIDDLLAIKDQAGRDKDLRHIAELKAIQRALAESRDPDGGW